MTLPRGTEYQQAVQTPTISFSDRDLRESTVENDRLGLPKPYSGGFTTTYRFKSNLNDWAVRCFTREIRDLNRRYHALNTFLQKNPSKYFVKAQYLDNGIQVSGKQYPIIKMEWLDGMPLNIYLSKNFKDRDVIESIIPDFIRLVNTLEKSNIAHGDLQHGNILVKQNQLFLIDYDGMYFPELSGLPTNEIGHINYQHPKRTSRHFNSEVDRFSSLVIYIALKALAINPGLWQEFDNGENILFKQKDFEEPHKSILLTKLSSIPAIRPLVSKLIDVCFLDFASVPNLRDFLDGNFKAPSGSLVGLSDIATGRKQYDVLDGTKKADILSRCGERIEVTGMISGRKQGYTRNGDPYLMLNMGAKYPYHTFTVIIWSETIELIKQLGLDAKLKNDQWISVTGVVNKYNERPQISLEQPTNIRFLTASGLPPTTSAPHNNQSTTSTNPGGEKIRTDHGISAEGFKKLNALYKDKITGNSAPQENAEKKPELSTKVTKQENWANRHSLIQNWAFFVTLGFIVALALKGMGVSNRWVGYLLIVYSIFYLYAVIEERIKNRD